MIEFVDDLEKLKKRTRHIAMLVDQLSNDLWVLQTRAAELHVQTDNGADVPLPVDCASDRTCPFRATIDGKEVSGIVYVYDWEDYQGHVSD